MQELDEVPADIFQWLTFVVAIQMLTFDFVKKKEEWNWLLKTFLKHQHSKGVQNTILCYNVFATIT